MRFTKMQGIGNDYIYINCFEEQVKDPAALSVRLSDRHFGIGGDGVILIKPSENGDAEMDLYNADGSRAKMCGNGIRCVGKYVYERGIAKKDVLKIDTQSGVKTLYLDVENGYVRSIRVNMGQPGLTPEAIPAILPGVENQTITAAGQDWMATCVSMGNPHCVIFVDDVEHFPLETVGPALENHPVFLERANIEFVRICGENEVEMRVWERGSGETWACGTGACAVAVACILTGRTGRRVLVHLRGGDLEIFWNEQTNEVEMTGPAEFVFDGEVKT